MLDDDLQSPTPAAPELRPAQRRRPAPAPEAEVPADEVASAVPVEQDEAVAALDLGQAAPEIAAPPATAEEEAPAATVAPVTKAATKAPAKRAAKKAPAKKAVAKKAPATEVVAKTPAKKAPAKKAPAKKAVAKKAPAKKATKAPAKKAPATTVAAQTVALQEIFPTSTVGPEPRARLSGGMRTLLVLTVLLVAAAAGLAMAAVVENGTETWRSSLTVRIAAGPATPNAAEAVATAQRQYAERLPGLTSSAAASTGVPGGDIRSDLKGQRVGSDQLRVVASAATPGEAQALAGSGASTVVDQLAQDQAGAVTDERERLSALASGYVTEAERTRPSDLVALLVGGAAALAVLLLAGCLALLVRGRD